jgi:hypothetical protein
MITYITPVTTVTGNATQTGTNVSTFETPWTLCIEVLSMSVGASAQILVQDSADGFVSDILAGPSYVISGAASESATIRVSWKAQDRPDLRIGISGCELRTVVQRFTGSGSLQFRCWIE